MTVPVSEISTVRVDELEARLADSKSQHPIHLYRDFGKRAVDVFAVLALSPIVVPLVALLATLIWLRGGHPFYTQMRVGRFGRSFRIYKLRTMVANSDEVLARLLREDPKARAEWNATQKLKNDPRVTKFGQLLRKTSLDELPQLWNVLIGDMSLVGPRPMMESQVALYPGHAYYRLLPGITGPWQISERNDCEFAGRARFDDAYDRSLSVGTDASILVRTIGVVLRGTGV